MFKEDFKFALQRFADIENTTSNTLVSGTNGDDTINNYGDKVTIELTPYDLTRGRITYRFK